jgi:adenylate cyclase
MAPAAAFIVFGLNRPKLVIAAVIAGVILLVQAHFNFPPERALIEVGDKVIDPIFTQTVITVAGLIAASVWYAFRLAEQAKVETDALLHNILPASVVTRLKDEPERLIADWHEDVTVIFTDISGFVALSKALGPDKVVRLLNEIVREFDKLAGDAGVEKIKTIGDAYMAVAGVPQLKADHAAVTVRLAVSMLGVVDRIKQQNDIELSMRIGIASGPVMAGVIGTDKFSYDVWGDTVNLASRLESASAPGRILVSDVTRKKVLKDFTFESAGVLNIKGQGEQRAWFVVPPAVAVG